MAKRQRWKDELKTTLLNEEDRLKKKPKIELLKEVVYRDGTKIRSTSYHKESFKCSPEKSHFITSPSNSKSAQVNILDLTPTFRKPKSYISETKRIIENIFSHLPPCSAEIAAENKDCTLNTHLNTHLNFPCTAENTTENEDCLPNIHNINSPYSAEVSPANKENTDCLLTTRQTTNSAAEIATENNIFLPNTNLISPSTAEIPDCLPDCLPTAQQILLSAAEDFHKNRDCSANVHSYLKSPCTAEDSPDNSEIQTLSLIPNEEISTNRILRQSRKKLNFDKCYLDFFEEDDADTLLLNEAFPSEESSCSFDNDDTSDNSLSNNVKKTRNNKKHDKNLKKKRNSNQNAKKTVVKRDENTQKPIIDSELQQENMELLTKSKQKRTIEKENKLKKALGQIFINKKGQKIPPKSMKPNPCKDVKCNRNCGDIPDTRRQELFNFYWSLGSCQRQRDWIAKSAIRKKLQILLQIKANHQGGNFHSSII